MITFLPYPLARRLHDAGLRPQTEYVYFVVNKTVVRQYTAEEARFYTGCYKEDKTSVEVVARATFEEVWHELPDEIEVDGIVARKSLIHNYIGYRSMGSFTKHFTRFFSPAELVEAAAMLWLELNEKGLINPNSQA